MRVGGVPASITVCETREDLIAKTEEIWSTGDDWIALGGGTNLVFAEDLSNLHVIHIKTTGIEKTRLDGKQVWKIQAGVDWDQLVAESVAAGLAGIEGMSGIPGTCGAAPVQNIGAYGQELSDVFLKAEFLDYESGELVILEPKDMKFGYRDSAIKKGRLGLITWIEIELLDLDGKARPLYSGQIAKDLNSEMGAQPSLVQVRESVLKLRASKSMVLDPKDPNSVSCGSFFTNPIVSDTFARTLPADAPSWETPEDDGL
jgi:UDP-N-acetylmuramate dehydrogenase